MARKSSDGSRQHRPIVRLAPLAEFLVYEITEAELEKLEEGPPGQLSLNFALALLPAALTVLITIQTVEIASNRLYFVYWIAFGILTTQGLKSLAEWWVSKRSLIELSERIRARMPEKPGVSEQLTIAVEEPGSTS